jgi:hypothetical protein
MIKKFHSKNKIKVPLCRSDLAMQSQPSVYRLCTNPETAAGRIDSELDLIARRPAFRGPMVERGADSTDSVPAWKVSEIISSTFVSFNIVRH